ncbi:MAG: putative peptidoglycan glycosyltransferase FtsW [Kiritimatiellia bacterium]|nr:putative peptidoglycan glycosyltransferase FtsW [Kiritimatiellia bacterium]
MRKVLSILAFAVVLLSLEGFLVLVSGSDVCGQMTYGNANHFWTRQLVYFAIGAGLVWLIRRFDYYRLYNNPKFVLCLFLLTIAALLCVFVPGLGRTINGSRRWIRSPLFNIQPSEIAKVVTVVVTSFWMVWLRDRVRLFWKGVVPTCLLLLLFVGPVVLQPDFGCAMVLMILAGSIMLAARMPVPYLASVALVGLLGVGVLLYNNENRRARLAAQFATSDAPKEVAYQLKQSLLAIRSGGLKGVGLGQSIQKHNYLPEAHTDFIFAIVGEELGFAGTASLVVFFGIILGCGLTISLKATDPLGRYIALGATVLLAAQAGANMGVVTGLLPTKGLALPFVSYGGSSILADCMALGLLFNVGGRIVSVADANERTRVKDAVHTLG